MNHHLRILQENIQAVTVGGNMVRQAKRIGGDSSDRKKKDLNPGQYH